MDLYTDIDPMRHARKAGSTADTFKTSIKKRPRRDPTQVFGSVRSLVQIIHPDPAFKNHGSFVYQLISFAAPEFL